MVEVSICFCGMFGGTIITYGSYGFSLYIWLPGLQGSELAVAVDDLCAGMCNTHVAVFFVTLFRWVQ